MVIGVVMACVGGRGCGGAVAFVGGRWTVCSSGSIRAGPVITGTDGLLPTSLEERPLERGLAAELTDHLGYDRGRVGSVGASQHEEAGVRPRPLIRRWAPSRPVVPRPGGLVHPALGAQGTAPARAAWIR
mgnify:CR=1 FL=1